MLVETVLSMLTVVCHFKKVMHRGWAYFQARLAFTMAAFNVLVRWYGLRPTASGFVSLSISWVRFLEACFGFFLGVIVACMSDYRHKRHNVSSLLYHIVCPAKYRRVIFDAEVDMVLKEICLDIAKRYELAFLEIGTDNDHVHFLVQSVPSYSPTKIVQIIKSLTAREIFQRVPTVKKRLWGGEFWSKGYFISTVGRHGNEEVIRAYVRQQGSEKAYTQLHRQDIQLGLF